MTEIWWEQVREQCPHLQKVDLLVGLLTFNQAANVEAVTRVVLTGLQKSFPNSSLLLVNVDVGSQDGTPEIIKRTVGSLVPLAMLQQPADDGRMNPFAVNRMSYSGMPGREAAFRCLFAMTERLQATACVVIDANVRSVAPEWIPLLGQVVLEKSADYVAPMFRRPRYEGSLTNSLIAPLTRALYGQRVACQTGGGYGFSRRMASLYLQERVWEGDGARFAIDSWLTTVAVAEGCQIWQAFLGAKIEDVKATGADVAGVLAQAVGATFHCMERYEDRWESLSGSTVVPEVGQPMQGGTESHTIKVERMLNGFRQGLRDLLPIWEIILAPDTLAGILPLGLSQEDDFEFPLPLWVQTVYDFAIAYHEKLIHREHLLRSLTPLYLGRTASLVLETKDAGHAEVERTIEQGCQIFESMKAYLVERWRFQ